MKRALLVVVLAALAAFVACAQTVVRETSVTVAWDAPPLELPDDVLSYRVYIEHTLTGARIMVAGLLLAYGLTPEHVIRHFDVTGKECPRSLVTVPTRLGEYRDRVRAVVEG